MKCKLKDRIIIFAVIPFFIVLSSSCASVYKKNLKLKCEQDNQKYLDKMEIAADLYSSSKATPKEIAETAHSSSEQEYSILHQSLIRYFTETILINKRTKALKAAEKTAQDSQKKAKQYVIDRVLYNRSALINAKERQREKELEVDKIEPSDKNIQTSNKGELLLWDKVKKRNTEVMYEIYLAVFPNGIFAEDAQTKLNELNMKE